MTSWTDTGALVVLHGPKPRKHNLGWLLVAGLLVLIAVSGCAMRPAPMSDWQCNGWRTLSDGTIECMSIQTPSGPIER